MLCVVFLHACTSAKVCCQFIYIIYISYVVAIFNARIQDIVMFGCTHFWVYTQISYFGCFVEIVLWMTRMTLLVKSYRNVQRCVNMYIWLVRTLYSVLLANTHNMLVQRMPRRLQHVFSMCLSCICWYASNAVSNHKCVHVQYFCTIVCHCEFKIILGEITLGQIV